MTRVAVAAFDFATSSHPPPSCVVEAVLPAAGDATVAVAAAETAVRVLAATTVRPRETTSG